MMLDDKLKLILSASPSPVPLIGSRWFGVTAGVRPGSPYANYQVVAAIPGNWQTQDRAASSTREWHYQFDLYGDVRTDLAIAERQLVEFLCGYADDPGQGIQAILHLNSMDGFSEQANRIYIRISEFTIIESL